LNALIEKVNDPDLVVLGFPSNNFGLQEPGKNHELLDLLKYIRPGGGFVPNFELVAKGDVNGADAHPLFKWLKDACPSPQEVIGSTKSFFWTPIRQADLTWNFEKFLIGRDGQPIRRYLPIYNPILMYRDVKKALEN